MGTTWQERETPADDGDDSPTVSAWKRHLAIDLRDGASVAPLVADEVMVGALLRIADAGVDDATAQVFLRCWSTEADRTFADSATGLAEALRAVDGGTDEGLRSTVGRWISRLAPPEQTRVGRPTGRRRLLSDEEVDEAVRLWNEAWSLAAIGRRLHVTPHAVRRELQERGIEPKDRLIVRRRMDR